MKAINNSSKNQEKSVVDRTAGSLTKYIEPSKLHVPFEEVMEETRKIVTAELVRKFDKISKS